MDEGHIEYNTRFYTDVLFYNVKLYFTYINIRQPIAVYYGICNLSIINTLNHIYVITDCQPIVLHRSHLKKKLTTLSY